MFWVLQNNLFGEKAFDSLIQQLTRQNIPYEVVKLIPFIHELQPDINPEGLVWACGAYTMSKIARQKGWYPGWIDENLEYTNLIQRYGDNMFNYGSVVATIETATQPSFDPFFIRPVHDSKKFAGTKMSWEEFEKWRADLSKLTPEEMLWMPMSTEIIFAPVKKIIGEYRFFVVDGKIATQSQYKQGDRILYKEEVDRDIMWFATSVIDESGFSLPPGYCPNRAFALDIFVGEDGVPKIGEINGINAAGFYAADMGKYVNAINSMKW